MLTGDTAVRDVPLGDESPPSVPGGSSAASKSMMLTAIFPVAILILALTFGFLELSGSSLGVYGTGVGESEEEAGVLAGPVRAIRSDEWYVRTPWLVRQEVLGLPSRVTSGMGTHDVVVLADLPTRGWEMILRPHTIGYHFLGTSRAIAVEWWLLISVQILGVYTLLFVLTGRRALASLSALLIALSPATQWWSVPGAYLTIGYGSLSAGLVLAAVRQRSRRRSLVLSIAAGLATGSFLATLYVPWQIGTAIVLVPVIVAALLQDIGGERGPRIKGVACTLAIALGIGCGLFVTFAITHREAIESISETVYPGKKPAVEGGSASLQTLLGGALDSFSAAKPHAMPNGTNQSENASALFLVLPVAVVVFALGAARRLQRPTSFTIIGSLIGTGILLAWMLLPLPAWAGEPLLLTRVSPRRLYLPVGFGSVLAVALLVHHQLRARELPPRWVLVTAAGLFAAAQAWAAGNYVIDGQPINLRLAGAFIIVVSAGALLTMSHRPLAGMAVLVAFSAWQASLINPIQSGTDPLTDSPLREAIELARRGSDPQEGWAAFSSDALVKGTITAAGVNHVTDVSPYPDADAWTVLDPGHRHTKIWNRYAHVRFFVGPSGADPTFALEGEDNIAVTLDPCGPELGELNVRFLVSQHTELTGCVTELARVRQRSGFVYLYRRHAK